MKIVVLVKYVPDIEVGYDFTPALRLDRTGDGLLNQLDEYPLDQARQLAEAGEAEVIALTLGPDDAEEAVRRALQMGADSGLHVNDAALEGSDAAATAKVLAAAIASIGGVDLVLAGAESADAGTGLVPVQVAARLGWPALTGAAWLEVAGGYATIRRDEDDQSLTLRAALPAVVTVTEQVGEPAYPSAKAVMLARKKPVDETDLEELEVEATQVGSGAAIVITAGIEKVPARAAGQVLAADDPAAVERFVALVRESGVLEGARRG